MRPRLFSHGLLPIFAISLASALTGCQTGSQQASVPPAPAPTNQAPFAPVPANPSAVNQVPVTPPPAPRPVLSQTPEAPAQPNITAKAAILVDARGRVLFEKNADMRVPVASTQKLLLGIMIAERGNLSQSITIQDPDTWAEPTVMGIKTGQVYTREELLRAVLVRSSNDIARALARDHSGSVSAFAAAMNTRARQLGMRNSYFTNASGLPSPPGQYSTARDLVILGQAAMRKPFVREAVRTKGLVFRFSDGTTKTVYNTNQVLKNFPYCTGMKTGFTNAAGRCLVSSATLGGRTVYAVILGSKTPTVWIESEALLKYGLSQ
ncbi:MAG: D-alanyl-D-alanine carboxypeptidase family protein [Verrucomicrobiota bacterium]